MDTGELDEMHGFLYAKLLIREIFVCPHIN